MAEEGLQTTPNQLIHIAKPIAFDVEQFMDQVEVLSEASYTNSSTIKQLVSEIIPTYYFKKKQDMIEDKRMQKLNKEKEERENILMIGGKVERENIKTT